jgi:hypothetical protein
VLQAERDQARLSSKKLTIRQKERLRVAAAERAASPPAAPATSSDRLAGVLSYLREFEAEQKVKRHRQNRRAAFRREAEALGLGSLLNGTEPRIGVVATAESSSDNVVRN